MGELLGNVAAAIAGAVVSAYRTVALGYMLALPLGLYSNLRAGEYQLVLLQLSLLLVFPLLARHAANHLARRFFCGEQGRIVGSVVRGHGTATITFQTVLLARAVASLMPERVVAKRLKVVCHVFRNDDGLAQAYGLFSPAIAKGVLLVIGLPLSPKHVVPVCDPRPRAVMGRFEWSTWGCCSSGVYNGSAAAMRSCDEVVLSETRCADA